MNVESKFLPRRADLRAHDGQDRAPEPPATTGGTQRRAVCPRRSLKDDHLRVKVLTAGRAAGPASLERAVCSRFKASSISTENGVLVVQTKSASIK